MSAEVFQPVATFERTFRCSTCNKASLMLVTIGKRGLDGLDLPSAECDSCKKDAQRRGSLLMETPS